MVSINSISLDSKLSRDLPFNRFCFVKVFSFQTHSLLSDTATAVLEDFIKFTG